jgi:hypothetical protein
MCHAFSHFHFLHVPCIFLSFQMAPSNSDRFCPSDLWENYQQVGVTYILWCVRYSYVYFICVFQMMGMRIFHNRRAYLLFCCREIRELVEWVVSEAMLVYYIQSFCDVMWPQGKLAPSAPVRTDAVSFLQRLKWYQSFVLRAPSSRILSIEATPCTILALPLIIQWYNN